MKVVNFNVVGTPHEDQATLEGDDGTRQTIVVPSGRASFVLLDSAHGGATVRYDLGRRDMRIILPPESGAWEADLPPVKPPEAIAAGETIALTYAPASGVLAIAGQQFTWNGMPWCWRGASDFRLPARIHAGESVEAVIEERQTCGATLLRCLAMKANNIGWELNPRDPKYWSTVKATWERIGAAGLACEWTVFADTKVLMPDAHEQQEFWHRTILESAPYPHVALELVNEGGHPTQAIDPATFALPTDRVVSRGSGMTDMDVMRPLGAYATYHARRPNYHGDGRGASNYSAYAYQENYPKPCPFVPDEGAKPQDYGNDVVYARLMGLHARCGAGGTFHTDSGIQSVPWTGEERACATAFFEGLR